MGLFEVSKASFPSTPGVYIVYEPRKDVRPLYVGVAERQTLRERWQRNHLRPRAGGSAFRRSLGIYLGLVRRKLQRSERYYPAEVEVKITKFIEGCWVELRPTASGSEAVALERELIHRLRPRLNVTRGHRLR